MAKSKEELIYDIVNELVDPTTNKITGERVKARLLDMVDAMGTGSGAMEYWAVPEGMIGSADASIIITISALLKVDVPDEGIQVMPYSIATSYIEFVSAVAIDRTTRMMDAGQIITVGEMLVMMGVGDFDMIGLTPMTEEEFYTIS